MDWTYNTLWQEQIPQDDYKRFELSRRQVQVDAHGASYVTISGFAPTTASLNELRGVDSAVYLELSRSNIRTFEGIGKLGAIKRLEVHYCLKLESGTGLSEIENSLEWLHIDQSKKLNLAPIISRFKSLKVLCLNNCAPIDNLSFLSDLPQLLDFRFVHTNVLDGDLTPILDHPTLVSVGFLNKRHYNLTEQQLDDHFRDRDEAMQRWVHKGPYRTFKYAPMVP